MRILTRTRMTKMLQQQSDHDSSLSIDLYYFVRTDNVCDKKQCPVRPRALSLFTNWGWVWGLLGSSDQQLSWEACLLWRETDWLPTWWLSVFRDRAITGVFKSVMVNVSRQTHRLSFITMLAAEIIIPLMDFRATPARILRTMGHDQYTGKPQPREHFIFEQCTRPTLRIWLRLRESNHICDMGHEDGEKEPISLQARLRSTEPFSSTLCVPHYSLDILTSVINFPCRSVYTEVIISSPICCTFSIYVQITYLSDTSSKSS